MRVLRTVHTYLDPPRMLSCHSWHGSTRGGWSGGDCHPPSFLRVALSGVASSFDPRPASHAPQCILENFQGLEALATRRDKDSDLSPSSGRRLGLADKGCGLLIRVYLSIHYGARGAVAGWY